MSMELEYRSVADFGVIITGKTPSTSVGEFWNGEIPFITPTDIVGYDMRYIFSTERQITDEGANSQINTVLPKNTICVSCIASIGKMCITSAAQSITNQQINSIVVKKGYDYQYLFYLLRYFLPYIQLIGGGTGSGTPIISKTKFSKLKYPVCVDKAIQARIAVILSNYDSLIEVNNKRIKVLEQMAENLYKEWFVRFRFPGHETAEFENGIPKGWEYKKLFDIARVTYGYAFSSDAFCDDDTLNAVVRIRDVPNNATKTYTSESCDDRYLIPENAVLVGMDGIFHMCLWNGKRAYLNQRVVEIESRYPEICNYFLFFAIAPQVKFWEQVIAGTTVAHLGDKHIKKMTVLIPDDQLLRKANAIINGAMIEKNRLFKQNENLSKQRDLLLPRLMSGKLEV